MCCFLTCRLVRDVQSGSPFVFRTVEMFQQLNYLALSIIHSHRKLREDCPWKSSAPPWLFCGSLLCWGSPAMHWFRWVSAVSFIFILKWWAMWPDEWSTSHSCSHSFCSRTGFVLPHRRLETDIWQWPCSDPSQWGRTYYEDNWWIYEYPHPRLWWCTCQNLQC